MYIFVIKHHGLWWSGAAYQIDVPFAKKKFFRTSMGFQEERHFMAYNWRYVYSYLYITNHTHTHTHTQSTLCEDPVYLHPSSALFHINPDYVIFQEISETKKLYMRTVTAVEETWLPRILPQYCRFSPPLETPPPTFDSETGTVKCHMTSTYGN